jgi:hypothetical protein
MWMYAVTDIIFNISLLVPLQATGTQQFVCLLLKSQQVQVLNKIPLCLRVVTGLEHVCTYPGVRGTWSGMGIKEREGLLCHFMSVLCQRVFVQEDERVLEYGVPPRRLSCLAYVRCEIDGDHEYCPCEKPLH